MTNADLTRMQQLAESDIAAQARQGATQIGGQLQKGTKTAADSFNRFVEGDEDSNPFVSEDKSQAQSIKSRSVEPEKKDFWDTFGTSPTGPSKEKQEFWDSFGAPPSGPSKEKKDFWDSFAEAGALRSEEKKPGAIGTGAVKKSDGPPGLSGGKGKKDDEGGAW